MKREGTNSFKDNINRMFLRYAIAPAFVIAFAGVLFTFLLWGYSTIDMVNQSNTSIREEIEYAMVSYQEILEDIAERTELITQPMNKEKRVALFESLYKLSNSLGYRADIYIFNDEYEPIISSTNEVPAGLIKNWG
ncbi:MAG: hypothetical protein SOX11_09175, partial [Lachnospiraceae bacterium]|nr:hypothetical protein [Lachnospiraceae bacterium]